MLKRQIPLAVMEAEKEDSDNIEMFWKLFNEALNSETGQEKFTPIGWCTDMAGANMNGIKKVFGSEAVEQRVKSCEFHYKENRNKMAAKLRDGVDAEIFKSLCDDLLMANLPETYNAARDTIHQFINEKPERGF